MDNYNQPENLQDLQDLFLDVLEAKDLKVLNSGVSYSNGNEHDMEVELPGGLQVFIKIRESQDDEYLIERYEGEENEPDDPDGRSRTMTLTDEGAEALRRELEEEEYFAEREEQDKLNASLYRYGIIVNPGEKPDDDTYTSRIR